MAAGRGNQLVVDQAGSIRLEPAGGRAEVSGDLVVRRPDGGEVRLEISAERVTLRHAGAEVSIDRSGDIELRTAEGRGTVRVHGDLEVDGEIRPAVGGRDAARGNGHRRESPFAAAAGRDEGSHGRPRPD